MAILMSFRRDTIPANVGADAEVPPTLCAVPPTTTAKFHPKAATNEYREKVELLISQKMLKKQEVPSGVARPLLA